MTVAGDADERAGDGEAYDVAVVGGGPAGCSAAVFTARDGLETVCFDRGQSSIARCAFLENYPGFPAGIDIDTFCALLHEHAERAGCRLVEDLVASVTQLDEGGFRLTPQDGEAITARSVIAATKYDGSYLRPLDDGSMFEAADEGGERFSRAYPDEDGRTPIEGLYVAGPLAGAGDQAVVAAGHGCTVARGLIRDRRLAAAYPDRFAEPYDWRRKESELTGEWADRDRWREYFDAAAPDDLDPETRERLRESYVDDRFAQYLDSDEIERRRQRGHRRLAEHLSPDALLAALDDETILAYARGLERDGADGA